MDDVNKLLLANRRLTVLCGIQAALVASMMLGGWQYQSNELTLRRLAIVDSNGRERVVLRGGDDGQGLVLLDSAGRTRCGLTVNNDLPGLRLYNENDRALTGLVINPTGPNLDFLAPDGRYIERHPAPTRKMLR
jgi:hypothetical protein